MCRTCPARYPCRRPAEPGLHRTGTELGLGDRLHVRTWSPAWVYVAFIVDVYSQRILARHASTSKATDLVLTPLRMAIWQRDHEGTPILAADLIHHSDAGSPNTPRSG